MVAATRFMEISKEFLDNLMENSTQKNKTPKARASKYGIKFKIFNDIFFPTKQ